MCVGKIWPAISALLQRRLDNRVRVRRIVVTGEEIALTMTAWHHFERR